jgi:hypothetical protein
MRTYIYDMNVRSLIPQHTNSVPSAHAAADECKSRIQQLQALYDVEDDEELLLQASQNQHLRADEVQLVTYDLIPVNVCIYDMWYV